MGLSRRNAIIGLGGLIAGGGALVGTGAFTTVQAERTVSVETTGDASAFLALAPARSDEAFVEETGGTIQINLDGSDSATNENNNLDDAEGLNKNARTRFENLVAVTNNGTQDVTTLELEVEVDNTSDDSAHEDAFKITVGDDTLDPSSGSPVGILSDQDLSGQGGGANTLNTGQTATFGVEIDLLNITAIDEIESGATFSLTISAETN